MRPLRILVAGMVAGDPGQGGASWAVLQYVLGLSRLGHDVHLVEPVASIQPATERYFDDLRRSFGLEKCATLLSARRSVGASTETLARFATNADVLINVSGLLRDESLRRSIPVQVYLDLDPAFNQLWHEQGIDVGFEGHTHYLTVGQTVGTPACNVPDGGFDWVPTLPPVVLDLWPPRSRTVHDALTTVGNWRGYGTLEHAGIRYGQKAHSLRRFLDLPDRTGEQFELALAIHPDERDDLEALSRHGFTLLDPAAAAGTPARYRRFVGGSKIEFGLAKEGYVVSRCGWFSDRSACYLAAGRPVIAQDTGFGVSLPVGGGLFAFDDEAGFEAAVAELRRDYGRHARAARAIAEEFLDSRIVLTRLLEDVGATGPSRRRTVHEASASELEEGLRPLRPRAVRRRPSAYRSTAPIVELDVDLDGSAPATLVVKDLSIGARLERLRSVKPAFLDDPLREIETYRTSLRSADLGTPALYGVVADVGRQRFWLFLEKVAGRELYQVGELELWCDAAAWLARLHSADLPRHDRLIAYDRDYYGTWFERARQLGATVPSAWETVIERLTAAPATLVHGEAYASNVLVSPGRTCLIDWEMAAVASGLVDLAALVTGWDGRERATLVDAYNAALATPYEPEELRELLACCRLHLALRWLGWSADWTAPPEHRHDWLAEARAAADEVGL